MFHQSSSLHINLLAFKNMKKTMHVPFNMQKDGRYTFGEPHFCLNHYTIQTCKATDMSVVTRMCT